MKHFIVFCVWYNSSALHLLLNDYDDKEDNVDDAEHGYVLSF